MSDILAKVYPSGFLGSARLTQTEPLSLQQIRHRFFDPNAVSNPQGHTASVEVMSLWTDIYAGSPAVKTFEFQEKILRLAKVAFGTELVSDWVKIQAASPTYTDYHHRWIDETLKYVLTGAPREYTYNTWYSLMTVGQTCLYTSAHSKKPD